MDRTPWLDRQEYPFSSNYYELAAGRMHYVDVGEGPVVVFVHGTPVWSFLYRRLIKALAPTHRCIAPDHVGFGLSAKPLGWSYRPIDHAAHLQQLIDGLGLRAITLVVHDFGGPLGLAYALKRPENVTRLVIFNTWMWSLRENREAARISQILSGRLGRFLYERLNFSPRLLIPALAGSKPMPAAIHKHYIQAAPTPQARHAMWVLACELIGSSDWYASLWAQRERISQHPALLLWGLADRGVKGGLFDLARWQQFLANARTVTYPNVGHFVPEEAAEEVAAELQRFLS